MGWLEGRQHALMSARPPLAWWTWTSPEALDSVQGSAETCATEAKRAQSSREAAPISVPVTRREYGDYAGRRGRFARSAHTRKPFWEIYRDRTAKLRKSLAAENFGDSQLLLHWVLIVFS